MPARNLILARSNIFTVAARLTFCCVVCVSAMVHAASGSIQFDIPAQSMEQALLQFSEQSGTQILVPTGIIDRLFTEDLSGIYEPGEALEALLSGTGLIYQFTSPSTVVVRIPYLDAEDSPTYYALEQASPEETEQGGTNDLKSSRANRSSEGARPAKQLIEEIVVTGRKREENLTDVPVAISVMNAKLLREAGIVDSYDLFDLAVGFEYDTGWGDRNTARPSVRGVQGNGLGVTQQKVNSFLDGFPLFGQQGTMQFADVERVELYRGPQSAAFGRSTFAGAINYVSRNPGEDFKTEIRTGTSNHGRDEIRIALSGPITDALGFTLDLTSEEYEGPDEWTTSDGYRLGQTATEYASAKIVFAPSDKFAAKLRYIHLKTDDSPGIRWLIPLAAQQACSNFTLPGGDLYFKGDVTANCNLQQQGPIRRNHDLTVGVDPLDPNYQLLLANSVLEPYARDERDRLQLELDFAIGDGALQVLAMKSSEYYETWQDSDNTAGAPIFYGGPNDFGGAERLGPSISHMANPYDVDEEYVEVRWVSPDDKPMRYVVGISSYDAYAKGQGIYETAGIRLGLDGEAIQGRPFAPRFFYGDEVMNKGLFGNIAYDLSDRTTVSVEARYQVDTVSARNKVEGAVLENENTAFLPRFSVTHKINDKLTLYGQYSKGTNPGGNSIGYTFQATIEALEVAQAAGFVSYDAYTFRHYLEEELTNLEFGLKGSAFEDRLAFTAAIYALEWENQTHIYTVNWDGAWNDGSMSGGVVFGGGDVQERTTLNEGTIHNVGVEFEGTYFLNDRWSLSGALSLMNPEYDEFCDVLAAGNVFGLPADGTAPATGVGCHIQDGNTPPGISETSYNLGLNYQTSLGHANWQLRGRLDFRHSGDQWIDTSNIAKIGERETVNSSVTVANESWSMRLWGNNLTDEDTPRSIDLARNWDDSPEGVRTFRVSPQRPREVGLTLSYRF